MKKALLLFFLLINLLSFTQAQDTLKVQVYFDFDQSQLNETAIKILNSTTSEASIQQIFIEGHTDKDGSDVYNQKLSEQRVTRVKVFFTKKNIPNHQITTFAYGEQKPLFESDEATAKAKNRRVDIMIITQKVSPAEKPLISVTPIEEPTLKDDYEWLVNNFNNIQDFWKTLKTPVETFEITNNDTILVTKGGMIIDIPKYAFSLDKHSNETITLEIHESLQLSQMLKNGLVTTDYLGNTIQTGGMTRIEARTKSGRKISLKKNITLEIPTKQVVEGMEYFVGKEQESNFSTSTSTTLLSDNSATTVLNRSISSRVQVLWGSTKESVNLIEIGLIESPTACCIPKYCIEEEAPSKVFLWKKFYPNKYKVYQEGMKKAKEQLLKDCKRNKALQAARRSSFQTWTGTRGAQRRASFYQLSISSLGFINCDRYPWKNQRNQITLHTNTPSHSAVDVFFISKKYQIITRGSYAGKSIRIPKGEKLLILGIGIDSDNQIQLATKEIMAESKTFNLDFKAVAKDDVNAVLEQLDL